MVLNTTAQKPSSKQSLAKVKSEKVTVQKSITEIWKIICNQVIQLPHTQFDEIGKVSVKLLAHTTDKNTKLMFTKTRQL